MDAARRAFCNDDPFNPLITTGMQASCMLVISHFFHLVLKPLGQPGPIANILAGLVLGPTLLCRIKQLKEFFIQSSSADYYQVFSFLYRVFFMFLIGLETDIPYMRRNLRLAGIIAYGGIIICNVFGGAAAYFILHLLKFNTNVFALFLILPVILSNSASPVVIRLAAELKIETSDVGRLGICTALINEMSCLILYSTYLTVGSWKLFGEGVLCLVFTSILIVVNKFLAIWFNKRNREQRYGTNAEVLIVFALVVAVCSIIEVYGYQSTVACFLMGLMFPREGKTARTLLRKLTYSVHNFILPIYFGYIGFQFNIRYLQRFENIVIVGLLILLSIGGKIVGTLAACHYLKIPSIEGVILAFILNLKGHTELLVLEVVPKFIAWWSPKLHSLVVIVVVLDTLIAGSVVAFMLRMKKIYFAHKRTYLESHEPESELRILACVYGSRHISATVGLISALSGSQNAPTTPYLMHLVELPKKRRKTKLMYHQLQDGDQFSDEEEYGANEVMEINDVVDAFFIDTQIFIHQKKVVTSFSSMYKDVCNAAEDFRVSIIIIHHHKHQRIDEKLENGKEGIKTSNQKVIRHAQCTVGILVDRGHTGFRRAVPESVQHVATLFFGGPDDREALACSKRMASHPYINLTVIRFCLTTLKEQHKGWSNDVSDRKEEFRLAISDGDTQSRIDEDCLQEFHNRYVKPGRVGYVEKHVNGGKQTAEALRELGDMYSLILVGKGMRGNSPMTTCLSDWEECPELGTVGDLLASSELHITSSVLVIQQHRHSSKDLSDD